MTTTEPIIDATPAIALEHVRHVWPDVAIHLHDKGYEWAGLVRASDPVSVQDHRIQIECATEADALVAASDHRSDAIRRALLVCVQEAYPDAYSGAAEPEGNWELSFTSRDQGQTQ